MYRPEYGYRRSVAKLNRLGSAELTMSTPESRTVSRTSSRGWSAKSPTSFGGLSLVVLTASTTRRACSSDTRRRRLGTNTNPMKSAPASSAVKASSTRYTPSIFTFSIWPLLYLP